LTIHTAIPLRWPDLARSESHPALFDDATISRYDPIDAGYFRSIARRCSIRQMVDLYRAMGITGKRRVLEIGAGAGQGSFAAACLNDEVLAIDVNPSFIELLEPVRARHQVSNLTIACRNFQSPLLPAAGFDAVICSEVLFTVDTEALVRRLGELVRPGGLLYVRTHCFPWAAHYWLRSIFVQPSLIDFALFSHRLATAVPRQLFGIRLSRRYHYVTRRELYRFFAQECFSLIAATGERGERDLFALAPVLLEWRRPGRAGILYFIDALAQKQ
jgi:SAM-dependent methyltransferase